MSNTIAFSILLVSATISCSYSAKILGIFYLPTYSHYSLGETLLKGLARTGHEVTMISAFRQKTPVENFRDVTIGSKEYFELLKRSTNLHQLLNLRDYNMPAPLSVLGAELAEFTLENQEVQDLLNSDETFDLVIMEQFVNEAFHGFAHHFKAPIIVLSTLGANDWVNHLTGNPALSSFTPYLFTKYSHRMNFWERSRNTLVTIYHYMLNYFYAFPMQSQILQKYFPGAPNLYNLMANTSMVFINTHSSCRTPSSLTPNMVEIGGYHIKEVQPLPDELKKFLDDATEGVVYFTFGGRLKTSELPESKLKVFRNVFSKIPMKVLWRYEETTMVNKSSNVFLQKWFPQQSVLAHPNLKIFISHGGMLSALESVHFGVPILGIPLQADQIGNMAEIVDQGYGKRILYDDLTEDSLYTALNEIRTDKKYQENVKMGSKLMQDRIIKPLDEAIYWCEYVIKHKGAHHLKTAAMNLTWYQQYLVDVFIFLIGCMVLSSYLVCIGVKFLLSKMENVKHKIH